MDSCRGRNRDTGAFRERKLYTCFRGSQFESFDRVNLWILSFIDRLANRLGEKGEDRKAESKSGWRMRMEKRRNFNGRIEVVGRMNLRCD